MDQVYDFGLRLQEFRKKKNMTQQQVAAHLGVTSANISGYENNTTIPPSDKLAQLAVLYRTTTDYLLNLDKRRPFYLEDLSESERAAVEAIMETVVEQIKAMQK